jgi:hypothetical protein
MRNWTSEARAAHSALIRELKPWKKSTGPRTKNGKTKSKRNALKHGTRSEEWKQFLHALRLQKEFVRKVRAQDK